MSFYEKAAEKLKKDLNGITDVRGAAMKDAVKEALLDFAEQEDEFAQAIVQGGSFKDCMAAVARGVGRSISDLEAYRRAVQFYFPGAEIRMQMTIDLIADAAGEPQERIMGPMILDFTQFL